MQKTVLKIDKTSGEVIEILRNQNLSNFVPFQTDKYKYSFIENTDELSHFGNSVPFGTLPLSSSPIIESSGELAAIIQPVPVQRSVLFPPTAEQSLSGTIYGSGFLPDEMVFQSTMLPAVNNYYLVSGVSQQSYDPVISTIGFTSGNGDTFGFVGRRCAQFMGTPLDSASQAAATIVIPQGISHTYLNHFLVSGFLYLNTTPSANYDPVIAGVVNNSTTASNTDSWVVDIDSDATKRVRFSWATASESDTGFPHTIYVTPSYGISLDQWHHWGVAYSVAGGSSAVSTYWNGERTSYSNSGFSGVLRNSAGNYVSVGADRLGNYPLKGYLEDLMISGGSALTSLRGFLHGSTAPIPETKQEAGPYTFALMSMDGPLGQSLFPCDAKNRVVSVCDGVFDGKLYVSSISNEIDSSYRINKGLSAFSGVCGGHSISGGSTGNSYVFGYDSGSCMVVGGVEQLVGLDSAKKVEKNRIELSYRSLLGAVPLYGTCGDTGPLRSLFSTYPTGFAGHTFSYLPIQNNIDALSNLNGYITVMGSTATFGIDDAYGNSFTMGASGIVALYKDVVRYFANSTLEYNDIIADISGATTQEGLKSIGGFNTETFIQTLSVLSANNRSLFVKPENKLLGDFKTSENVYSGGLYSKGKGTKPSGNAELSGPENP